MKSIIPRPIPAASGPNQWLHRCLAGSMAALLTSATLAAPLVLPQGNRQLFVDRQLIAEIKHADLVLHQPQAREPAIKPEHPWEKYGVSTMVVFRDGDLFRAWYLGEAADSSKGEPRRGITAYAESKDGITWVKPELGLVEFEGSKRNNIVWDDGDKGEGMNWAPFRDDNPAALPDERYKAIAGNQEHIYAYVSPDGLRWKRAASNPLFSTPPFDSHNVAFWDPVTREYRIYSRGVDGEGPLARGMSGTFYRKTKPPGGVRAVRYATSKDFKVWSELKLIETGGTPREDFYTNSTIRYERAPDYLLMFPSRFATARVPDPAWPYGGGVNDIVMLSSRDGAKWDRTFMEAFIRPGLDQGNWHERSLYMERGIIQTSPTELSLYCMHNWRLPSENIRRYTLRPDGFVSVRAGYAGGELVTKPFVFAGTELELNFSTSAIGAIQVEIQDEEGNPLPGFAQADCPEFFGDKIEHIVQWTNTPDLGALAGRTVRLRFVLADADLYAFRFR